MTVLKPTEGLLTFESEGHEGGRYQRLSVAKSGLKMNYVGCCFRPSLHDSFQRQRISKNTKSPSYSSDAIQA